MGKFLNFGIQEQDVLTTIFSPQKCIPSSISNFSVGAFIRFYDCLFLSYHVRFWSESTFCSCLDVKEPLVRYLKFKCLFFFSLKIQFYVSDAQVMLYQRFSLFIPRQAYIMVVNQGAIFFFSLMPIILIQLQETGRVFNARL